MGLVLAHQHLDQLTKDTREAVAANARTRVVFQCSQDDARSLAREFSPWLSAEQLLNLQRYQVAVVCFCDGHTERPFTGVTSPAPPSLGSDHVSALAAAAVRALWPASRGRRERIEDRLRTYNSEAKHRDEVATADHGGRSGGRSEGRRPQ